jgi:uncharacterized membrane protein
MLLTPALASVVETLTKVAEPWKRVYDDSKLLETVVVFVHLASLLVGGGIALASDRATLRAWRGDAPDRARQLAELGLTHRIVIPSLVVAFVSGVALFLTDVETFAGSVAFWVKMGLVALLLLNGLLMTRAERVLRGPRDGGDTAPWGRLRTTAVASGVLWLATLLAGVALTNAS